ncbi:MAG: hypothetical protein GY757_60410, partial [bacterium]|nr:hypothetical protein [bacterium]
MKKAKNGNPSTPDIDGLLGSALSAELTRMGKDQCLEPEEIAVLVEGNVTEGERDRLLKHISACESCYDVFLLTSELQTDVPGVKKKGIISSHIRPLALAASVLVVVLSLYVFFRSGGVPAARDALKSSFDAQRLPKEAMPPSPEKAAFKDEVRAKREAENEEYRKKLEELKIKQMKDEEYRKKVEKLKRMDAFGKREPSEKVKEQLKSLGYINSGDGEAEEPESKREEKKAFHYSENNIARQEAVPAPVATPKKPMVRDLDAVKKSTVGAAKDVRRKKGAEPGRVADNEDSNKVVDKKAKYKNDTSRYKMDVAKRERAPEQTIAELREERRNKKELDVLEKSSAARGAKKGVAAPVKAGVKQIPISSGELEFVFNNSLMETQRVQVTQSRNIKTNRAVGQQKLAATTQNVPDTQVVFGADGYVSPDIKWFLSQSKPGSVEHKFFVLASRGWCDNIGACYGGAGKRVFPDWIKRGSGKTAIDKKLAAKLLVQWKALQPRLDGVFRDIAKNT